MKQEKIAYLSLGSNLGDREKYLELAEKEIGISSEIRLIARSRIYESEALGMPGNSGRFLNRCLEIKTSLKAPDLLLYLQKIEKGLGRLEKGGYQPRTIDIDILLYGETITDLPALQIPHQRISERKFVLIPLLEINPALKDPISQKSYREILEKIKDNKLVTIFNEK